MLKCPRKSTVEFGLYPFEHSLAALARAQMGTTQTQLCFILGIWARFGIIYLLNIYIYKMFMLKLKKEKKNKDIKKC